MEEIPTRRFGRTELQMPVLTCGGMRFQQSWEDICSDELDAEGQANVERVVDAALKRGIYHFETARGYGSSELQMGKVLSRRPRDQILVQTKVGPRQTAAEFIAAFETSLEQLQLTHVDLLAVHGINLPEHLAMCLRKGGTLDAVRKLQREGRVRFAGFSTHGSVELVTKACQTGEFDFVNLHWYYSVHPQHWPMVEAAAGEDMGVFIISPNDKGGRLYDPSEKLRRLCKPLTPMQWNTLFCLSHPEVHTLSIGAAKPEDWDAHVAAVCGNISAQTIREIEQRLTGAMVDALGKDWCEAWHRGLPRWDESPEQINVREIVRLWNLYQGLDLLEYAKSRYNLLGNASHWFPGATAETAAGIDWAAKWPEYKFADKLGEILKESHRLFAGEPKKRLSESGST